MGFPLPAHRGNELGFVAAASLKIGGNACKENSRDAWKPCQMVLSWGVKNQQEVLTL